MAFKETCAQLLPIVEANVRRALCDCESRVAEIGHPFLSRIYSVLREFTSATGGKRLRPICCIMAYRMCGGNRENEDVVERVATALELLHNTTLVHDDIMDEDEKRRGAPTVWKVLLDDRLHSGVDVASGLPDNSVLWASRASGFAVSHAILAGNVLFGEALRLCKGAPEAAAILSDAYLVVHHGQVLDMVPRDGANERDYVEMSNRKTGWLFRASLLAGAALAGAAPDQRKALEAFALDAALAFQIQDDIMDIDAASLKGHARGSDIRQGKATLLALGAIAAGGPEAQELTSVLRRGGTTDEAVVDRSISLIERSSLRDVQCRANGLADSAKAHLRSVHWQDESCRQFFDAMADFFVQRNI